MTVTDMTTAREIMVAWLDKNAVMHTSGEGAKTGKEIGEIYRALLRAVADAHKMGD